MKRITIEGGKAALDLRAARILHLMWRAGTRVEDTDADAALAEIANLCRQSQRPLLINTSAVMSVSPGARIVFAGPCAASPIA